MFIKLTAIRVTEYGTEDCGKIMIRKDQVAAITGPMAFNFNPETGERFKNKNYRGNSIVHLTSGKVFPVQEKFTEVEAMLLGQGE